MLRKEKRTEATRKWEKEKKKKIWDEGWRLATTNFIPVIKWSFAVLLISLKNHSLSVLVYIA